MSSVNLSSSSCPPPHPPHPHCPCSKQEYVLSDGIGVNVEAGKEVNQDIVLQPNPFKDCGTISGIVKDKHGKPIEHALVKVFDSHHQPVAHVFTNKEGQFLLCVKPGHYIVKAIH